MRGARLCDAVGSIQNRRRRGEVANIAPAPGRFWASTPGWNAAAAITDTPHSWQADNSPQRGLVERAVPARQHPDVDIGLQDERGQCGVFRPRTNRSH
jgi:hypothetical protein